MKRSVSLFFVAIFWLPMPAHGQQESPDSRELLQRLAQGDRQVVPGIVKRGEAMIPELAKLLQRSQRDEKVLVAHVIAEIASRTGVKAQDAARALCETLSYKDKAAASEAARALGFLGAGAVPELTKTLKTVEKQPAALYAVRALTALSRQSKDTVPAVLAVLKANSDPQVQIACIKALGAAGPAGKEGVKDLLRIAQGDENTSRSMVHILVALGEIGPDAHDAVPFLAKTLQSAAQPHYRIHALEALARIDPAAQVLPAALAKMLASPDLPRIMILESLNKSGPLGKEALKAVEDFLRDKDSRVRLQAAIVVGKTNPNHPAVVSVLIESLEERDPAMRRRAAETIGEVRPRDEAVLAALNQRAMDTDLGVRQAVAEALARYKKK